MARRKVVDDNPLGRLAGVQVGDPERQEAGALVPGEEQDPIGDLEKMLDGHDGDAIGIYRTNARGMREFCDRIPVSEFDLLRLREEWGAGTYTIQILQGTKIVKSKTVRLAAVPLAALPTRERDGGGEVAMLRDMVRDLIAAQSRPQGGGFDQNTMMQMMATMSTAAAQQATTLIELFKKMSPEPIGQQNPMQLIETVRSLMELRDELAPAGGGGSDEVNVIKMIAPAVPALGRALEAYAGNMGGHKTGAQGAQTDTAGDARLAGGSEVSVGSVDRRAELGAAGASPPPPLSPYQHFAPLVSHLLGYAANGTSARLVAATARVQGGKLLELAEEMVDTVGYDEFVGGLVEEFPALVPHRTWVDTFVRAAVVWEVGPEDDVDGEEEGAP